MEAKTITTHVQLYYVASCGLHTIHEDRTDNNYGT